VHSHSYSSHKSLLLIIAFAIAGGSFAAPHFADAGLILNHPNYTGLNNGLVGYWSFDGKDMSDIKAYDRSGQGNDGTLTNGPVSTEGKLGQALRFNSSLSQEVNNSSPTGLPVLNSAQTISGWFNRTQIGNAYIMSTHVGGTGALAVGFTSDGHIEAEKLGGTILAENAAVIPSANQWHHFVYVYRGSNKHEIWIDDVLKATGSVAPNSGTPTSMDIGTDGFGFGYFPGSLDEVRIYNRALSADEIKRLYRIGATLHVNTQVNNDSLKNGLVGYWSFDGKDMSGNIAYDRSGQNHNGTLTNMTGGVSGRIEGKLGQALNFDGVNDYATFGTFNTFPLPANATSISAWVYPTRNSSDGTSLIMSRANNSCSSIYIGFGTNTDTSNGGLEFDRKFSGASNLKAFSNPHLISLNQWQHVAVVWNGSTAKNQVKFYVNGVDAGVNTGVGTNGAGSPTDELTGTNDLYAGGCSDGLNAMFTGKIDDVRFYNRVLTPAEIKRLYRIGATLHVNTQVNNDSLKNGLVGYWSFDGKDMSGNIAYDRSGQNNNGTLTNGPVRTEGKLGQALNFDGVNDYAATPVTTNFGSSIITVSFWLNFDHFSNLDDVTILELSDDFNSFDNAFAFLPNDVDGSFHVGIQSSAGVNKYREESFTRPSAGSFHHYAAILDNSTNTGDVTVYVDGVLQNTIITQNTKDSSGNFATDLLYFMSRAGTSAFGKGVMDDIRVYNRALSADEIKRLYRMGGGI
jgi:hypothetical protein